MPYSIVVYKTFKASGKRHKKPFFTGRSFIDKDGAVEAAKKRAKEFSVPLDQIDYDIEEYEVQKPSLEGIEPKGAINKELLENRAEIFKELNSLESKIKHRIRYVLECICRAFGQKLSWWDTAYCHEDGDVPLDDIISKDGITPYYEPEYNGSPRGENEDRYNWRIIRRDGNEWYFSEGFPYEWLFEPFEEELLQGIEKHQQFLIEEREKKKAAQEIERIEAKAREEERLEIIESLKTKLEPKELKALGIG